MKLTEEVSEELNDILRAENSAVRLYYTCDGAAKFVFSQDVYVEQSVLYASQVFLDKVEQFLTGKGITNIRFAQNSMVFTG